MAVRRLMTDCEDAAHRLQWRDRGRFSRPFLFPRFTKRGTAGTGVVRTATTYGKLAPAVGEVNGGYFALMEKFGGEVI